MAQVLLFAGIIVAVVLVGLWWMVRSAHPGGDGADPHEPTVVGEGTHMDMEIARSKLDAAGILAYTRSRSGPIMPGGVAPQLFGWEVLVRSTDIEAAAEVLAAVVAELPSHEPRL
jgi:predicted ATP-grasp superfamily ATP-dependent carboligase